MQDTVEKNQVEIPQAQRTGLHNIRVRVGASFLGVQGMITLISTVVNLISNPFSILSTGFLVLNVGIFFLLLAWGLWALKRWAYWSSLLVEVLVLIRGVFIVILPSNSLRIGAWEGIALLFVLYLLASPNARAVLFQKDKKPLPENEKRGISPHLFE